MPYKDTNGIIIAWNGIIMEAISIIRMTLFIFHFHLTRKKARLDEKININATDKTAIIIELKRAVLKPIVL
ncbi:hypothetical protein D3C73_1376370 [compost metagenome]